MQPKGGTCKQTRSRLHRKAQVPSKSHSAIGRIRERARGGTDFYRLRKLEKSTRRREKASVQLTCTIDPPMNTLVSSNRTSSPLQLPLG